MGGPSAGHGGLVDFAEGRGGLRVLGMYWYDGAVDAVPTADQQMIAALPKIKLRLGRITGGRQKGVVMRSCDSGS